MRFSVFSDDSGSGIALHDHFGNVQVNDCLILFLQVFEPHQLERPLRWLVRGDNAIAGHRIRQVDKLKVFVFRQYEAKEKREPEPHGGNGSDFVQGHNSLVEKVYEII